MIMIVYLVLWYVGYGLCKHPYPGFFVRAGAHITIAPVTVTEIENDRPCSISICPLHRRHYFVWRDFKLFFHHNNSNTVASRTTRVSKLL